MDPESLIKQFAGSGGGAALEQAAQQHLESMAPQEVSQHLQTAAANANENGQPRIAQELEGLIARKQVDPDALKEAALSYIKANPEVLTHFAPSFAQGILNRVL